MATKHITDAQVLQAVEDSRAMGFARWPYDLLAERTGEPEKVCYRAMERADRRGYLDWGVSLRTAWLTDKGRDHLSANARSPN